MPTKVGEPLICDCRLGRVYHSWVKNTNYGLNKPGMCQRAKVGMAVEKSNPVILEMHLSSLDFSFSYFSSILYGIDFINITL